jgi:plastocyanin
MGIALRSRLTRQAAAAALLAPLAVAPVLLAAATASAQATGPQVKATIDNKFDPLKIEVKVGDEVTWTAEGVHSVNGGGTGQQDPASPIKGSEIGFQTYSVKFDKAGTYPYFCLPHFSLGMTGEVVVTEDGPKTGATGAPSPSGTAAGPGAVTTPTASSTPATQDPNLGKAAFEELEREREEPEKAMSGFRMLLWGLTGATLVLSAGVFAATRPRREA